MTTEDKALIERLRQRSNSNYMLMSDPPKPAPDADCHAAADLLEQLLPIAQEFNDFRQEVSDAVSKAIRFCKDGRPASAAGAIGAFVIPKPKPDPLTQTLGDFDGTLWGPEDVLRFRATLEARGLKIVEVKNDD